MNRLVAAGSVVELRPGARVFAQGDPADAVYAILGGDGCVRIGAMDRRSKSVMVEVFHAGDLFGEIGVIDGGVRTADGTVEGRIRLRRIPAPTFLDVLATTPALGLNLSRLLARRIRRTFALFQDAAFEPLEVRLARQLLYLADVSGQKTAEGTRLSGRFRQADLADLLGATPRSIITILNSWRGRGLLTYNTTTGLVTIGQEQALRDLIAAPPPG